MVLPQYFICVVSTEKHDFPQQGGHSILFFDMPQNFAEKKVL
jgi:hypothetical protein